MAHEDLAPTIRVLIEGHDLPVDVTDMIVSCQAELTEEMADKISLSVLNPAEDSFGGGLTGQYVFTDSTMFQAGNTILVYMGYGLEDKLVGAGIIQKYMPVFPDGGSPTLTIVAYDGSVLMMEGEASRDGAAWEDTSHSDAVAAIATAYGFDAVVDQTVTEKSVIKKQGMSDWEFINGLARLHGFEAKVRWDEDRRRWKLWWGANIWEQDKQYTFVYAADGQSNTLLSFEPELALKGQPSEVKVLYFDDDTRTWEEITFKDKDKGAREQFKYAGTKENLGEIRSSTAFRIAAGGISVEVVPGVRFETAEDAQKFGERWFRARKDQFIIGRGKTMGVETLKPGGVHNLQGVGRQLSGEYQFTTVTHIYGDGGYICEFFGHKLVT